MAKRKIRLLQGAVSSAKIVPKDSVLLTTFAFTSGFDQLTADAMGIKDTIYDSDGARRHGLRGYEPELELFGAIITVVPEQKDLFQQISELTLTSIKLDGAKILRAKADETLKFSFKVTVAGIPREAFDFIEILRKGTALITIEQPTKQGEQDARMKAVDFGLFKEPKGEDGSEDGEDSEEDSEEETPAASEKESGTLARAGQMKVRGRRGAQGKNVQ